MEKLIDEILAIYKRIDKGEIEGEDEARKEIADAIRKKLLFPRPFLPKRGTAEWCGVVEDALDQVILTQMKMDARLAKLEEDATE